MGSAEVRLVSAHGAHVFIGDPPSRGGRSSARVPVFSNSVRGVSSSVSGGGLEVPRGETRSGAFPVIYARMVTP